MRKALFIVTVALAVSFTACNTQSSGHGHGEATHQHDSTATDGALAGSAYICPMKCEGSASDGPGKCPVCKMDLVTVEELQNVIPESHQHD